MPKSKLHVKTFGNSQNPALLFLHGFLGCGSDWDQIAMDLSDAHFAILPDLPGHGQDRSSPSQFSFAAVAHHLVDVLDRHEIAKANLIGYSMGARLGLFAALEFQDRFSSLTLESCNPGTKSPSERMDRGTVEADWIAQLAGAPMADFIAKWYDMPLFATLHSHADRLAQLKARRVHNQNKSGLIQSLQGLGLSRQINLWPRLAELSLPVMLVVGAADKKFQGIAEEMSRQLVDCRYETVANAGHNVHFERQEAYLALLRAFWSR